MTQGINNPLPPPSSPFKATLIFRYFLRYFSSTSTEQISPASAGPFIVSILLALLFSLNARGWVLELFLQQRLKDALEIESRAANDLEHVRRCGAAGGIRLDHPCADAAR